MCILSKESKKARTFVFARIKPLQIPVVDNSVVSPIHATMSDIIMTTLRLIYAQYDTISQKIRAALIQWFTMMWVPSPCLSPVAILGSQYLTASGIAASLPPPCKPNSANRKTHEPPPNWYEVENEDFWVLLDKNVNWVGLTIAKVTSSLTRRWKSPKYYIRYYPHASGKEGSDIDVGHSVWIGQKRKPNRTIREVGNVLF